MPAREVRLEVFRLEEPGIEELSANRRNPSTLHSIAVPHHDDHAA